MGIGELLLNLIVDDGAVVMEEAFLWALVLLKFNVQRMVPLLRKKGTNLRKMGHLTSWNPYLSVELQVESLNGVVLPVIIAGSMEQIVMLVLLGPLMW